MAYAGASLLTLLGFWYGFTLYTTGVVMISINDQTASLSIYQRNNTTMPKQISSHKGDTRKRLKPGRYIIQAATQKGESSQLVTVTARETQDLAITLRPSNDTQIIASAEASAVTSNDQNLLFLDQVDGKVKRITTRNTIESVSEAITFKRFEWLDINFGVGLADDNQLYTYSNTQTPPQKITEPQPARLSRFSVSPDQTIYSSGGTNTYRYTPTTGFVNIDTTTPEARLTASPRGVLISSSININRDTQDVVFIKTDNKKITSMLPRYTNAVWDQSGNKLALTTQSGILLYNSNLELLDIVPATQSTNSIAWANNILIYTAGDNLWGYDTNTKMATKIASTNEGSIKALQSPNILNFIYFSIDKPESSGGNRQIAKTSIKKFFISQDIQRAQELLPVSTAEFNIDFINLTRPTIYISSAEFSDDTYRQSAQDYLTKQGLDINNLLITVE